MGPIKPYMEIMSISSQILRKLRTIMPMEGNHGHKLEFIIKPFQFMVVLAV